MHISLRLTLMLASILLLIILYSIYTEPVQPICTLAYLFVKSLVKYSLNISSRIVAILFKTVVVCIVAGVALEFIKIVVSI